MWRRKTLAKTKRQGIRKPVKRLSLEKRSDINTQSLEFIKRFGVSIKIRKCLKKVLDGLCTKQYTTDNIQLFTTDIIECVKQTVSNSPNDAVIAGAVLHQIEYFIVSPNFTSPLKLKIIECAADTIFLIISTLANLHSLEIVDPITHKVGPIKNFKRLTVAPRTKSNKRVKIKEITVVNRQSKKRVRIDPYTAVFNGDTPYTKKTVAELANFLGANVKLMSKDEKAKKRHAQTVKKQARKHIVTAVPAFKAVKIGGAYVLKKQFLNEDGTVDRMALKAIFNGPGQFKYVMLGANRGGPVLHQALMRDGIADKYKQLFEISKSNEGDTWVPPKVASIPRPVKKKSLKKFGFVDNSLLDKIAERKRKLEQQGFSGFGRRRSKRTRSKNRRKSTRSRKKRKKRRSRTNTNRVSYFL